MRRKKIKRPKKNKKIFWFFFSPLKYRRKNIRPVRTSVKWICVVGEIYSSGYFIFIFQHFFFYSYIFYFIFIFLLGSLGLNANSCAPFFKNSLSNAENKKTTQPPNNLTPSLSIVLVVAAWSFYRRPLLCYSDQGWRKRGVGGSSKL